MEGLAEGAQPYVLPQELEDHRYRWATIAAQHGWYREPFYVQVWVDAAGHVVDSVSTIALDADVVLEDSES